MPNDSAGEAGSGGEEEKDIIEVRCPKCNEKVRVSREKAERDFQAKCSKGHEVPLAKAL